MDVTERINLFLNESTRMPRGNAPSLDSLKYKGKPSPESEFGNEIIQMGDVLNKKIFVDIGKAINQNDPKKVRTLMKRNIKDIGITANELIM